MIINAPTGLYRSKFSWVENILKGDSANITWYISSNNPPVSKDAFSEVTPNEDHQNLPPKWHTQRRRRQALGPLIFSIEEAHNTDVGSVIKQFEPGQALDAQDIANIESVSVNSSNRMETRHDTNVLDVENLLDPLGVDAESIIIKSELKMKEYTDSLNEVKASILDIELEIKEKQKKINEYTKIQNAARLVDPSVETAIQDAIDKLNDEIAILIDEHDQKVEEAEQLKQNIRNVAQLVR